MKAKQMAAAVLAGILGVSAATALADGCTGLGRMDGAETARQAVAWGDAYVVYPEASPEIYPAPAYVVYPEASHVAFSDGDLIVFDDPVPALAAREQAGVVCAEGPARIAALGR
jgi:hypothetical protein